MGKYDPLRDYLRQQPKPEVTLTFEEIERIIGKRLVPAAKSPSPFKRAAWWADGLSPTAALQQRCAWREAGFTAHLSRTALRVTFRRRVAPDPLSSASS